MSLSLTYTILRAQSEFMQKYGATPNALFITRAVFSVLVAESSANLKRDCTSAVVDTQENMFAGMRIIFTQDKSPLCALIL